jgi:hypothetical protein
LVLPITTAPAAFSLAMPTTSVAAPAPVQLRYWRAGWSASPSVPTPPDRAGRELVKVGFADHHRAGGFQPGDHRRIIVSDVSDYVSGGSSSGSASVLARGLVGFSLGTDTAGSGRVNQPLVGFRPTILLNPAGTRPDPAVSVPREKPTSPRGH